MKNYGYIFESAGKLRAVLIREGVSQNGNNWPRRILESMVDLVDGVPVNLYDTSESGNKTFFAHWDTWRMKLPPGLRRMLPTSLPEAQVGVVRNPKMVIEDNVAHIEGDIETSSPRSRRMISGLIRQAKALGRSIGPSIHVAEGDLNSRNDGPIRTLTQVSKVTGFEIVSFPSAGGTFLPVLEALEEPKEDRSMSLVKRLLRLLSDEARKSLVESVDLPPDSITKAKALASRYPEFVEALFEGLEQEVPEGAEVPILEALSLGGDPDPDDHEEIERRKRKADTAKAGNGLSASATQRYKDQAAAEAKEVAKKKSKKKVATEAAEGGDITDDDGNEEHVSREEFDSLTESMQNILTQNNTALVEARIKAAELPEGLEKFALQHFTDLIDNHGIVALESVDDFLVDLRKGIGRSQNSGGNLLDTPDDDGGSGIFTEWNSSDKINAAMEAMIDGKDNAVLEGRGKSKIKVPAFQGLRQAYGVLTGDLYMEGRDFFRRPAKERKRLGVACEGLNWEDNPFYHEYVSARGGSVTEALIDTSTFPLILSNLMHKAMVREYKQMELKWKLVGRAERVTDFKDWRFLRLGEFANLLVVNEGADYLGPVTQPSEEEITLAIVKHGGYAELTWETLVNDDLRRIQTLPAKLSRAAARTLNDAVFNKLANNENYTTDSNGGVSLANAAHNNHGTTAYSWTELKAMRAEISAQQDIDTKEPMRATPRHVLVGTTLYDQVYEDLFSDGQPYLELGTAAAQDTENPGKPNILRSKYGLDLHEVTQLDANDYWVTADPSEIEMIAVGFLNGQQNPAMFVQDLDRVGTFFDAEKIRWKIRHIWQAEILDYRGFSGRIVV